jgi:hypothetical protein
MLLWPVLRWQLCHQPSQAFICDTTPTSMRGWCVSSDRIAGFDAINGCTRPAKIFACMCCCSHAQAISGSTQPGMLAAQISSTFYNNKQFCNDGLHATPKSTFRGTCVACALSIQRRVSNNIGFHDGNCNAA